MIVTHGLRIVIILCLCCCSITKSFQTLCNPMDCSMPGFPVLHYPPEYAQTHILWVSDAIQPLHPLSPPSPPALNLSQHQGLFQWVSSSHQAARVFRAKKQWLSSQETTWKYLKCITPSEKVSLKRLCIIWFKYMTSRKGKTMEAVKKSVLPGWGWGVCVGEWRGERGEHRIFRAVKLLYMMLNGGIHVIIH